jgi:hypothetical protein
MELDELQDQWRGRTFLFQLAEDWNSKVRRGAQDHVWHAKCLSLLTIQAS